MTNVLAVVAHPDDDVLGPGGTLLRHIAEGDAVRVLMICTAPAPEYRMTGRRLLEAGRVAKAAGWELQHGNQPTLALDIAETTRVVEEYLDDAEIVYTHHRDLNRDHRTVHEAVRVATRPFATGVKAVRCFNTPSASEWGDPFVPNYFVTVDVERKVELLDWYASELRLNPHPRSVDGVMCHAEFWGRSVGLEGVEPFVTLWERR